MGRKLDDVIKSLPAGRQAKIAALAQEKREEMLLQAATLTDFRKAVGKTQAEVAKQLGINQNAVSQLESRSDTYVSTLRRFLQALDLRLELSVIDKHGVRIDLPNFLHWPADAADADPIPAMPAAAASLPKKAIAAPRRRANLRAKGADA
jgi:transcriptional regulator with XRE-family HTH domain